MSHASADAEARKPRFEQLLRAEGRFAVDAEDVPWAALLGTLFLGCASYGVVMGAFALRPLQSLYSGIKVPLFLLVATALTLPSFYVLNSLLGLRADFRRALRGVLAAQATIGLALVGLIPLVVLLYVSTHGYRLAQLFNGFLFAIASLAGQVTLARHYAPLVARDRRHAIARRAWLLLYVFVAIQTAWLLRPFVGGLERETTFLRADPFTNAYIEIVRIVRQVLGRLLHV